MPMGIDGIPPADVAIDPALVGALLGDQHPDLSRLPLADAGSGWDNCLYRLGDDLAVRLPRRAAAAALIEHEQRWLAQLAPLPLPIPVAVRVGRPGRGYPWAWSVVPWFEGQPAATAPLDAEAAVVDLAAFVTALHRPAPSDAPRNPLRGVPLEDRAEAVYRRAADLDGVVDREAVLRIWDEVVRAPHWPGPPLWIHGDLHPGNLLVSGRRLTAVIDFGDLTSGDPATDLAVAWMLLPPASRTAFRAAVARSCEWADDHVWRRARGWALALGLAFLASSRDDETMRTVGRATVDAVLGDAAPLR